MAVCVIVSMYSCYISVSVSACGEQGGGVGLAYEMPQM